MHDQVQEYYGKTLQGSADLQTNACCTDSALPAYLKPVLANIHDEVMTRYYGCGLIAPDALHGMRILDLGCGAGRDVYALSALVGEAGTVIGVDMTDEQLAVANRHRDYHADKFGFRQSNVTFLKGYIEKLDELDLPDNSIDIIVSNCVINLSPDKAAVLREAHRLLKPGGELYFSDVYSDKRVPAELAADPVLYGECLGGALYWNDFQNLAKRCGFADPRLVEDRPISISNPAIEEKIGHIRFFSATYRLFKIDGLEPACEDYGQAVVYKGTVAHQPQVFRLDKHHLIQRGKIFPVCGNTYRMLQESRFRDHFDFIGNWDTHYGIFEGCGTSLPYSATAADAQGSAGCC
ncbi:MAG: methyltransferase domain-containing protein [Pseudomonadota bacterium]